MRLECPALAMLLVISARTVCEIPVLRPSAWTTRAGRRFAVRRSEFGNRTRTTSPRLKGIVNRHLRSIPILSHGPKLPSKLGGFVLADLVGSQVNQSGLRQEGDQDP